MSIEHQIDYKWSSGGRSHQDSVSQTGSGDITIEETVADSQTDSQIACDLDVSAMKTLYLESDQDVTIETNSADTPDDTINLTANNPIVWQTDGYTSNPFTVDVTDLYVTNASGSEATIKLESLYDATP